MKRWKQDITIYLETLLHGRRGKPLLTNPLRDWKFLLGGFITLLVFAFIMSVWLFFTFDGDNSIVFESEITIPPPTVDRDELTEVLEFFVQKEIVYKRLQTKPPRTVDPS